MLQREELEAVFVLTEPDTLFRLALNRLLAGKHVLMEKPPGISAFQVATLLRTARRAGRICQVGLNRRHIPLVRHVVKLMKDHITITQVEGRFNKHVSAAFAQGSASAFESDTIHAVNLGIGGASCRADVLLHEGAQAYSLGAVGPGDQRHMAIDGKELAGSDAFHYYDYLQEDQELLECVRDGRRPLADIEEALKSMQFAELLRRSLI